jgi:hypothetical protein
MPHRTLTDAEAQALWRRAAARLELVDVEPPVSMAEVDALLGLIGPRRVDEPIVTWLRRGQAPRASAPVQESAEIIPFNPRRQRFTPVANFVRLAADTSGLEIPLPARALETDDGQFRLEVTKDGDELVISIQALGQASDLFAGRTLGLQADEPGQMPVALITLDEDGDGAVRLADRPALRRALLRPLLGVIEDV